VSKACQLLWRNLHARGTAGQITVFGKNGRTRAIALPAELWSELIGGRGAAKAEEPVRSGEPLDRVWEILPSRGRGFESHTTRKTSASRF
jgi:hypothetical protein